MLQQIKSIEKILSLDFEILFCSHNPQFKQGKKLLEKKLQFFQQFYQDVAELQHQDLNANQIFKKLNLKEKWKVRLMSLGV